MISFPNCKINLGLKIFDKRQDGYHNLESILYPINWFDSLEMVAANEFSFETAGIQIDGRPEDNLCVKAYKLLKTRFNIPIVKIFLLKNIPQGAGLGGGSADAAFMLKMLNQFFDLKIPLSSLQQFALQLGTDCPFFIENRPCIATGKGEQLTPVNLDLSGFFIVVVYPGIILSTSLAYTALSENRTIKRDIIFSSEKNHSPITAAQLPIQEWKQYLNNDFEEVIFQKFPEIESIKTQLYDQGAIYASMSGSGSAIYGIFRKRKRINLKKDYRVVCLNLS
ncbi:MAG: 4-(cytidine 5'-diphospho)-2-C-methyl-D-erythritol kinase [Chitinophagales bacterium]|nr:4-(cytidine 5'-diphospho)-2-C-methyl-D-erythritol kinase [Chitinophagales bacterium]